MRVQNRRASCQSCRWQVCFGCSGRDCIYGDAPCLPHHLLCGYLIPCRHADSRADASYAAWSKQERRYIFWSRLRHQNQPLPIIALIPSADWLRVHARSHCPCAAVRCAWHSVCNGALPVPTACGAGAIYVNASGRMSPASLGHHHLDKLLIVDLIVCASLCVCKREGW